ncbi:P7 protein (fragment) [Candidatus Accumulibacter aalborgensis]|uniref:p7 protein n=1 Tax=Candidatus Accumulibacter aalborgensis TaxID=1860102 RepID=A0A1A8XGH7_9PROT
MYAFGDALLFLAVFGVVALFPTGLAIYFWRHRQIPLKKSPDQP